MFLYIIKHINLNNMKTDIICSLNTSKGLKAIGFNKIVGQAYTTDFRHNGKHISFEQELDLKDEGKENEIEKVPFGDIVFINNRNSDHDEWTCSAPLIYEAATWLKDQKNIIISVEPTFDIASSTTIYLGKVYYFDADEKAYKQLPISKIFKSMEKAIDFAILCAVEHIKTFEKDE